MTARVAQARDVALSEMNFRGFVINTEETAITVDASDSGIIFMQNYATEATYTLPDVTLGTGKMFKFVCINTATKTVITTSDASALIKGTYTVGVAKTTITSGSIGDSVTIVGDGTYWYVVEGFVGGWTTA